MIYGLDTGFLVAAEVVEHVDHSAARAKLAELSAAGDELAIAPQVLAEFIHVVTDSKRFAQPLEVSVAINLAEQWWTARDVRQVLPTDAAVRQFLEWMRQHSLGRKRLLDTLLAATYSQADVTAVLTTNPRDFTIFGCFQGVTPVTATGGMSRVCDRIAVHLRTCSTKSRGNDARQIPRRRPAPPAAIPHG